MKKKKLIVERILSGVFTLLGFASCSDNNGGICEYGTPTLDFQVKGTVTSETGKPIENVQVIVRGWDIFFAKNGHMQDTVYTNEKGEYISHVGSTIGLQTKNDPDESALAQRVIFNDQTGIYKSDSTFVADMPKEQTEKGNGWYEGKYLLTADKQLKK